MLKPQEGILRSPSDANGGTGLLASTIAELAHAVTGDIKSRQAYLDSCDWIPEVVRKKIKVDASTTVFVDRQISISTNHQKGTRLEIDEYCSVTARDLNKIWNVIGGTDKQKVDFFVNLLGLQTGTTYLTNARVGSKGYSSENDRWGFEITKEGKFIKKHLYCLGTGVKEADKKYPMLNGQKSI